MNARAFTIVEVIIAIVVLTIGVLGLLGTAALVTRMIARSQRSAIVAAFTQGVMEEQRRVACTARQDGSQNLKRGSTRLARASWTWSAPSPTTFRLLVTTVSTVSAGRQRTDLTETTISCIL